MQRQPFTDIPFIFQSVALLAAFTHPSHIVIYAPGDSFTCRRAAARNLLGIINFSKHNLIYFYVIIIPLLSHRNEKIIKPFQII
ncbi:hypothetical protein TI10_17185 [Photorhabdus luminescens subsp. luminescens]|uniref:Uncharacterized protein n=1 Tax=Photorhabdus luminescens TaxID=29488 RepID=A0A1G5RF35_PHOLU|nr:hypothetical protein TI10_17185 [Photorhabdus luminescens subsp. luminescens]SCZ71899.1 hypothetical protein SAMN02982990_03892 [Photorhabdus luminescens]